MGIVIMVDKTSPRCDECRNILKYGHREGFCSKWSREDSDRGKIQMELDREELN